MIGGMLRPDTAMSVDRKDRKSQLALELAIREITSLSGVPKVCTVNPPSAWIHRSLLTKDVKDLVKLIHWRSTTVSQSIEREFVPKDTNRS